MTLLTLIHVGISLVALFAGLVILFGLLAAKRLNGWTKLFLTTTALTSGTGFLFPFHGITPGLVTGSISLVVLAVASYARYARRLAGGWRKTYVIGALLALYLNVFVLIVQSFQKIPALKELTPGQDAPLFRITQTVALVLFVVLGIVAAVRFRDPPANQLTDITKIHGRPIYENITKR